MSVDIIFTILAVVFVVLLIYGGIITRKWITDASDFILAGREVSLLLNVFGVAAIGFAGTSITLSPGFSVLYGFWGSFICLGIIYSLGGLSSTVFSLQVYQAMGHKPYRNGLSSVSTTGCALSPQSYPSSG